MSYIDTALTGGKDERLDVDIRRRSLTEPAPRSDGIDGVRVTVFVSVTTVTWCWVSVLDLRRTKVSVLDIRRKGARSEKTGAEKSRSEMSGTLALRLKDEERGRLRVPVGEITCWTGMFVIEGVRRNDGIVTSRTSLLLLARGRVDDSVILGDGLPGDLVEAGGTGDVGVRRAVGEVGDKPSPDIRLGALDSDTLDLERKKCRSNELLLILEELLSLRSDGPEGAVLYAGAVDAVGLSPASVACDTRKGEALTMEEVLGSVLDQMG